MVSFLQVGVVCSDRSQLGRSSGTTQQADDTTYDRLAPILSFELSTIFICTFTDGFQTMRSYLSRGLAVQCIFQDDCACIVSLTMKIPRNQMTLSLIGGPSEYGSVHGDLLGPMFLCINSSLYLNSSLVYSIVLPPDSNLNNPFPTRSMVEG